MHHSVATPDLLHTLLDDVTLQPLLEPTTVAGLELRNRFAMAPMTREFSPNGVPGEDVAAYYARRAGSVGLLITEGTYVDEPSAGTSDRVPRVDDHGLEGWREVVSAVHERGGKIAPQLWHLGAARRAGSAPHPHAPVVSPSGVDAAGRAVGEPADQRTLDAITDAFARSAVLAKRAGFDALELHGAHGYLLDEFLWSTTNQRSDGYGGSLRARLRFPEEVVTAVREAVGPDLPIIFRFSQWKSQHYDARIANDPGELEVLASSLAQAGVDIFHVSTRRYWDPAFDGSDQTVAEWTRKLSGLPTIAVGSVGIRAPFRGRDSEGPASLSLRRLVDLFERGAFDLVAVGRALLAEPHLIEKLATGRLDEIQAYSKDIEQHLY